MSIPANVFCLSLVMGADRASPKVLGVGRLLSFLKVSWVSSFARDLLADLIVESTLRDHQRTALTSSSDRIYLSRPFLCKRQRFGSERPISLDNSLRVLPYNLLNFEL